MKSFPLPVLLPCFLLHFCLLLPLSLSLSLSLVRVMKLKNNILYPVEGNLVTTILPDDKLILKCLVSPSKESGVMSRPTPPHSHSQHHVNSWAAFFLRRTEVYLHYA